MRQRRPMGALEHDVLQVLWQADESLTPSQVRELLGDRELAYTTVMTILTRLCQKGLVQRKPAGRTFDYRVVVSEAELAAERMRSSLPQVANREAALSRFVDGLSASDTQVLQRILGELEAERP